MCAKVHVDGMCVSVCVSVDSGVCLNECVCITCVSIYDCGDSGHTSG